MKSIPGRFILLLSALALSAQAEPITIKSSDTLLGLSQKWADAYKARHADAQIEVTTGATTTAFAALAEKKINLALTARAIRYKETQPCVAVFGQRPTEVKVGVSGVAVYVHADNPVKELMYEDLEGIFTGKHKNWKRLGGKDAPIVAYGMGTNTAAGELFTEEVLGGKAMAGEVHVVTDAELLKAIALDPNSLGFAPLARTEGIRALNIKRVYSSTPVEPSEETISNRIYPISRFLYGYLDPAANQGATKAYLDWLRSDEGQGLAKPAGYFPLAAKWRAAP
jgi:phosphate transport system substrate-binding protein